jgi:hypothetical protein
MDETEKISSAADVEWQRYEVNKTQKVRQQNVD